MALSWFRRSRGKEAKQEHQEEVPVAPVVPQARVPLKLRGLLLLNLKPSDGVEQIESAPPLGDRDTVITALNAWVPGISFDAAGKGQIAGAEYRLTLDLGQQPEVHGVIASAEGDAAIELLRGILEHEGWRAYSPRAHVFIEPDALDLFALPE